MLHETCREIRKKICLSLRFTLFSIVPHKGLTWPYSWPMKQHAILLTQVLDSVAEEECCC